MDTVRGSCLCGGVRFAVSGPFLGAAYCHCSACRKAQGAVFRPRVRVQAAHFTWLSGEDLVTFYESSPDFFRGFCRVCGSPICNRNGPNSVYGKSDPASTATLGLSLAILDDDPLVRPTCHAFVASKLAWYEITDDLPQHPGFP